MALRHLQGGVIGGGDAECPAAFVDTGDGAAGAVEHAGAAFAYGHDGHLAHGYAMTIHKAQGATTDHELVLVDETMSREAIYTAMSRGRKRNDLYLAVDTGRDEIAHAPELVRDPVETLAAGVRRSTAQQMAVEDLRGIGR